jgi:hypothetical protein
MTSKNLEKHRKKFQNLISGETSETKPKRKSVIRITDSFDTSDNNTSTNLLSTSNDNSSSSIAISNNSSFDNSSSIANKDDFSGTTSIVNKDSYSGTTNEVNSKIYVKRWVPNENIEGN